MTGLLLGAGAGAVFGFASGVLVGGRISLWLSPAGEHDILAFMIRWGLPLAAAPTGALAALLIFLSHLTTRMAKGFIGSVAGDGTTPARLAAAGALGMQLNRTLGTPVILMRTGGWGLLALLAGSAALAVLR